MSEKLVTLDLLKAFGDKSKKIFRPTTVVNSEGFKYLKVETLVPSTSEWSFNIELWTKGDLIEGSYSGDLKATITASNNTLTGLGAIYYGNYLKGVSFIIDSDYVTLLFEFEEKSVVESLVDILNYKDNNGCNIVNKAEFIQTLDDYLNSITAYNTIGVVNDIIGIMGTLNSLDFKPTDSLFQIRIPSKTSEEDTAGVLLRIPGLLYTIDKVNNSKWSDYLLPNYKVIFKEGDLESFYATFGGDTKTEIVLEGPKINNLVKYYEGYKEGDFVGRVKVNSNGLITEVEKDPELPAATDSALGCILTGYVENSIQKNYPVVLDSENKAYVHVPWNDTDTWNKVATSDELGLIQIGFLEQDKKYPVKLDSDNKAYVEVPWTDTVTEIPEASDTTSGTIKLGYEGNDKNYPVEVNTDGQAFVNVPWTDTKVEITKATEDTLGVVKLGALLTWYKKALKLELDGSAYIHFDVLPESHSCKDTDTLNFNYNSSEYHYITFTNELADLKHLTLNFQKDTSSFLSIKNMVVRIYNKTADNAHVYITLEQDVQLCNMFDALIVSNGVVVYPGQNLELVFTFWDVNDISFNGGFSL